MPNTFTTSADYAAWLVEVKSRVQSARISAAQAVNRDLILLYWDIGRGIVEKQEQLGWGKSVVDRLSRDLRAAFPTVTGFSPRNLWDMKRFYVTYSEPEVWRRLSPKAITAATLKNFCDSLSQKYRGDTIY